MIGLPYTVSNDDIEQFFHGYNLVEDSIKIGKYQNGKNSGEAVVAFATPEDTQNAYNDRYKKYIGSRFIELLAITDADYNHFCKNFTEGGSGQYEYRGGRRGDRGSRGYRGGGGGRGNYQGENKQYFYSNQADRHQTDSGDYDEPREHHHSSKSFVRLSDYVTEQNRHSTVKIRGLPFNTTVREIRNFFADFRIAERDIILDKSHGQTTGYALVMLQSVEEADRAKKCLDKQYVGNRYVDVFTPEVSNK